MPITDLNTLIDCLGNRGWPMPLNKTAITAAAGQWFSLWRAGGTPGQGAIPAGAAICSKALAGAWTFPNPSSGRSYLGKVALSCSNAGTSIEIHDRLGHMGGLSGAVTTPQVVDLDLSQTANNLESRKFTTDYTCIQWWLEWYTNTGSTSVTATVTYTDANDVADKTVGVTLPASVIAGRMLPIAPPDGVPIKKVQSVTLSGTTGTAGSFGVTATVPLTTVEATQANLKAQGDWATLGLPRIHDSACLMIIVIPSTTTTGIITGMGKLAQG